MGGGGIYVMDRDGSNPTLVIETTPQGTDFSLAFAPIVSPDGTRILFFAYLPDERDRELFVSDLEGGNIVRLTTDEFEDQTPAGFSASENLIAYASRGQIWT